MKVIDGIKGKDAFDKNIIYAVENEDTSFCIIKENQMVAHIISSEPYKNRYYADLFTRALRDGVREKCETCKYRHIDDLGIGYCKKVPLSQYLPKNYGCNYHEKKAGE